VAPYKSLKAWQHAQRLAVECARAAKAFPEYEQDALADQLRRACYTVVLNIAEGSAKRGSREYRRYLDTANGSLAEVETALGIARELEYLEPAEFGRLEALATETGKTLFGLLRKITEHAKRSPAPKSLGPRSR
jgi:four helix bundle protein